LSQAAIVKAIVFHRQVLQVGPVIATLIAEAEARVGVQSGYLAQNQTLVGTKNAAQVIQTEALGERRIDAAEAVVTQVATKGENVAVAEIPLRRQSQVVDDQTKPNITGLKNRNKVIVEELRHIWTSRLLNCDNLDTLS